MKVKTERPEHCRRPDRKKSRIFTLRHGLGIGGSFLFSEKPRRRFVHRQELDVARFNDAISLARAAMSGRQSGQASSSITWNRSQRASEGTSLGNYGYARTGVDSELRLPARPSSKAMPRLSRPDEKGKGGLVRMRASKEMIMLLRRVAPIGLPG